MRPLDEPPAWLFRLTQQIRDSYADGQPPARANRKLILSILRRHLDGRRKFGTGIGDVFVDRFIGGHRCFWVLPDASVEDFRVRVALGRRTRPRSPQAEAQMARFDTAPVVAAQPPGGA